MSDEQNHGWVFPISDGTTRARCGGPSLCGQCARDHGRRKAGATKFGEVPETFAPEERLHLSVGQHRIPVLSDCRVPVDLVYVGMSFGPGGHSCTDDDPCGVRADELRNDARARTEYLDRVFTYHPPTREQAVSYETIRAAGRQLADEILRHAPAGEDRQRACDAVREAVMWANASIATQPPEEPT